MNNKPNHCDAMGHYGGSYPEGICPKCGKPWGVNQPPSGMTPDNIEGHLNAFRYRYNAANRGTVNPSGLQDELPPIPDWIINYDKAAYHSSAGKAVRFLMERVKKLEKQSVPPSQPLGISSKSFLDVLIENYQAQIAGFYNYDKTDVERGKRNAVIEEYQDLISIFKAGYSASEGEERKFTLKEALEIWEQGREFEYREHFGSVPNKAPDSRKYFKEKFGIEI